MASDDTTEESGEYEVADEPLPMPAASAPAPAAIGCAVCHLPIVNQYFVLGPTKTVICAACRSRDAGGVGGSKFLRFLKATALGILGGLVGAAIWFAVRRATGYEIGLVAIVVGLLVGFGVHVGSERRGGRGYQFLAIVLTYLAIAINYGPDVYQEIEKGIHQQQSASPAAGANPKIDPTVQMILVALLTVPLTLAAPVLAVVSSPISVVIAGIALWEAWKINRARRMGYAGPFTLGAPSAGFVPLPPPTRR